MAGLTAVRAGSTHSCELQAGEVGCRFTDIGLIERRRIGPVIRALQCQTDPLFRRAGLVLE
jgi:hypothetical protein